MVTIPNLTIDKDNRRLTVSIVTDPTDVPPPTLAGDFDGDGAVGFSDFLEFAVRFGARQGDPNYDSLYDLDASGDVGFGDFLEFAVMFGTMAKQTAATEEG